MGAEMWTALSGVAVSGITALGTVWVARAGRRTAEAGRRTVEQEQRDNFTTFTKALNEEMGRLKTDLTEQKEESARQRRRIGDQDLAIGYLLGRLRTMVDFIRKAGLEPPAAPPMPERVREYIHHIDV
jgi:hypothetical protein